MKLKGEYKFDAPVEEVWKGLLDPEVLASVMPGCEKLEMVGEGKYEGDLKVKVGPVQGKFKGKVDLQDIKEAEGYTINVDGKGPQGFVKATAKVSLESEGSTTLMRYDSDAKVGGRIASVGQRLLDASAKAIIKQSLGGLNDVVAARASTASGGTAAPVPAPPKVSQTSFAVGVAKEVTKELIPPPVRIALIVVAVVVAAAVIYMLVK